MVQVDVFWSYGLASGLTLAAGKRLKNEQSPWVNPYFIAIMGWISLLFAPSGLYLLWAFPYWETMFLAKSHADIPAWLVLLFAISNITQAILGYWVTSLCLTSGRVGLARMQAVWSHAAMLAILVFGWDGSGWRRFTYAGNGEEWTQGVSYPWTAFFTSPVFYTLLGMALFFIPSYAFLVRRWTAPVNRGAPLQIVPGSKAIVLFFALMGLGFAVPGGAYAREGDSQIKPAPSLRQPVFIIMGGFLSCKGADLNHPEQVGGVLAEAFFKFKNELGTTPTLPPRYLLTCFSYEFESPINIHITFKALTDRRQVTQYNLARLGLSEGMVQSDFYPVYNYVMSEMIRIRKENTATDFYLIGHSIGGWTALQLALRIQEHRLDFKQLLTLDPISPVYCAPGIFVGKLLGTFSQGCHEFPRDVTSAERGRVAGMPGNLWHHFYQAQFSRLHSGPVPELVVKNESEKLLVNAPGRVYRNYHRWLAAQPRIWKRLQDLLRSP